MTVDDLTRPDEAPVPILDAVLSADDLAPRVPWSEFIDRFPWNQGEHMALIGPTGSGKTTLAQALLPKQPFVCVIATKPKDKTMNALAGDRNWYQKAFDITPPGGYRIMRKWQTLNAKKYPKRILWPRSVSLNSASAQSKIVYDGMAAMYGEGGWCVFVDELWYLVNELGLEKAVRTYLLQARSLGISFTVATQRPARVPLEVYDQSMHLFFWRDNDEANLKRISGISWRSARQVRELIANLDRHEFLYVNTVTGIMARSKAER